MTDVRQATLNVPCTGEFNIYVRPDGGWSVLLNHKNNTQYIRIDESLHDNGVFMDTFNVFNTYTIPEWMWECVMDKVNELTIAGERDSLVTPNKVQDYVQ